MWREVWPRETKTKTELTMVDLQSQEQEIRCLKAGELDLWLQFLVEAFGNKHPNMLELFTMLVNKDKQFHMEDVLLLGQRFYSNMVYASTRV